MKAIVTFLDGMVKEYNQVCRVFEPNSPPFFFVLKCEGGSEYYIAANCIRNINTYPDPVVQEENKNV